MSDDAIQTLLYYDIASRFQTMGHRLFWPSSFGHLCPGSSDEDVEKLLHGIVARNVGLEAWTYLYDDGELVWRGPSDDYDPEQWDPDTCVPQTIFELNEETP